MLEINYTLFIQIANFLFLLFLLNIIVYRPIREILNRRREEISSAEGITEDWKQKADTFAEELEENITVTRKEGFKERENLKEEGVKEERVMLQGAYSTVEEKTMKTREEIQERMVQVRQSLQAELGGFSKELAEKILGREI